MTRWCELVKVTARIPIGAAVAQKLRTFNPLPRCSMARSTGIRHRGRGLCALPFGGDMTTYSEKLKDPRWQKKRLRILERDKWTCQHCNDTESTLHVHHGYYEWGIEPWEYPDRFLHTYCKGCHELIGDAHKTARRCLGQLDTDQLSAVLFVLAAFVED